MRLSFRPLTLAIALSCAAGTAGAADLMEAYELARKSDPVLAAAESRSLAVGEALYGLLESPEGQLATPFPNTSRGGQLARVARMIKVSRTLGAQRRAAAAD